MVDKEMASTSAAIEDAVRRIEVSWTWHLLIPVSWDEGRKGGWLFSHGALSADSKLAYCRWPCAGGGRGSVSGDSA